MVGSATKTVRSSTDLAVFGAPPAFTEPLHVGRPNMGDRAHFDGLVAGMFERGWFTNDGPLLRDFEREIAVRSGVDHCVAMCNATVALEIAIRALGMTGEVIVPAFTFVATAHALSWQGIRPLFADIDESTHTLDPDSVRSLISERTTGIVGVHMWGRSCDSEELQKIADEHGLSLLFDAAHAFGCSRDGTPVGSAGDAEVFSFHSTKFFNSFEGGAVVTNDEVLAEKMRLMRNFGFTGYDEVIHPGTNGKMTEICAAMGLTNLQSLEAVRAVNRKNHARYEQGLVALGIPVVAYDDAEENNFQYVVALVPEDFSVGRDELVSTLHAENVLARRYFYPGCHRQEPYASDPTTHPQSLDATERVAGQVLVLPTGASVADEAIDTIIDVIAARASGPTA